MATCDICNAEMDFAETMVLSIDDLDELMRRGFGPPDKVVRMAMSAGWTREQVVARWQQELDARPKPYWMFCPSCMKRADRYMPVEEVPAEGTPAPEEELVAEAPEEASAIKAITVEAPAGEPAEEVLALEEEEEEEEAEFEVAGRRPRTGRIFLIGLVIGLLGGAAFYLLVLDRTLHPVTPTPVPTRVVVQPSATIAPTRVFPTRRPATPRPTEALYPPTVIPVPDLAGVVLAVDDLPTGFREMPEDRQETLGMAEENLAAALDLAQGRLRLLRAFENPTTDDLLVSFLVYPLTPAEQEAFDSDLAHADAGLPSLWAALAPYGWAAPSRVAELDRIGERGVWLTSVGRNDADGLVLEVFVARQGPVLEFVLRGYTEDSTVGLDLVEPVRLLDARVSALVSPTRLRDVTPSPTALPLDLADVMVLKEDLPSGFVALAESEWSDITGAEALSNSLRFFDAQRQNETVLIAPAETSLYVVSWVDYPLSEMESGLVRKSFAAASTSTGAELLGIPAGNWRSAVLLKGLEDVGEAAFGFTGVDNRSRPSTRVQVVQVYRDRVLVTLLASYADGTAADLDLVDVARALDGRLEEALDNR
jgi:hypothetical protein